MIEGASASRTIEGIHMKLVLTIVGALMMILGAWFIAQGTGLAPIGFMANHMEWAYRGAGVFVVGLILFVVARRL